MFYLFVYYLLIYVFINLFIYVIFAYEDLHGLMNANFFNSEKDQLFQVILYNKAPITANGQYMTTAHMQ